MDVLLLDEPTRGIDVGSKAEIYRHIDELAAGDSQANRPPNGSGERSGPQKDSGDSENRTHIDIVVYSSGAIGRFTADDSLQILDYRLKSDD